MLTGDFDADQRGAIRQVTEGVPVLSFSAAFPEPSLLVDRPVLVSPPRHKLVGGRYYTHSFVTQEPR